MILSLATGSCCLLALSTSVGWMKPVSGLTATLGRPEMAGGVGNTNTLTVDLGDTNGDTITVKSTNNIVRLENPSAPGTYATTVTQVANTGTQVVTFNILGYKAPLGNQDATILKVTTVSHGAVEKHLIIDQFIRQALVFNSPSIIIGKTLKGYVPIFEAPMHKDVILKLRLVEAPDGVTVQPTLKVLQGSTSSLPFTITSDLTATQQFAAHLQVTATTFDHYFMDGTFNVLGPTVTGISLSPLNVTGGDLILAKVLLSSQVPTEGFGDLDVFSNLPDYVAHASVPNGYTTGQTYGAVYMPVLASAPGRETVYLALSPFADQSMAQTVRIQPYYRFTPQYKTVVGGVTAVGTVTLFKPSVGDTVIPISSSSASAQVPRSITITNGNKIGTFNITTSTVASSKNAKITIVKGGTTQTMILTITP
ncbi:MAG: hypothetical protein ACAH95_03405 [Fimbriimonas sp.]